VFSSRLQWQATTNSISQAIARKTGPVLDLTESNPTRAGFLYPEAQILAAFQNPAMLVYDPDSAGLAAARQHLANTFSLDAAKLILTSSTSEAYTWLFKLLCDPGDEVLVPRPSYPLFDFLAALENVSVAHYPLNYGGAWSIDLHSLQERITARTRAIVIVHPNNPTGSYVSPAEMEALDHICRAHDMALISDEVFADYALDPKVDFKPAALSVGVTAFSLNGLSKMVGMPQMKLGWILTNNPEAHTRLELIADTYLSVGTPVQYALPALLEARAGIQQQICSRLRANLSTLQEHLSPRHVEGGWYAILQVPQTLSEEQWVLTLLNDHDVLVQPGYFYDFPSEAFLVLSLLTRPAIFAEGIDRLRRTIERYS
jgi:alanine-synthesizing transaminase